MTFASARRAVQRAALQSEDDLQASIACLLDVALEPPAMWNTLNTGAKLSKPAAARLARLGLKPSWPDCVVVSAGRVYGIEIKTPAGRLTLTRRVKSASGYRIVEGQAAVFPRLVEAGMPIAVCRSPEDVMSALHGWQIPLRGGMASAFGLTP